MSLPSLHSLLNASVPTAALLPYLQLPLSNDRNLMLGNSLAMHEIAALQTRLNQVFMAHLQESTLLQESFYSLLQQVIDKKSSQDLLKKLGEEMLQVVAKMQLKPCVQGINRSFWSIDLFTPSSVKLLQDACLKLLAEAKEAKEKAATCAIIFEIQALCRMSSDSRIERADRLKIVQNYLSTHNSLSVDAVQQIYHALMELHSDSPILQTYLLPPWICLPLPEAIWTAFVTLKQEEIATRLSNFQQFAFRKLEAIKLIPCFFLDLYRGRSPEVVGLYSIVHDGRSPIGIVKDHANAASSILKTVVSLYRHEAGMTLSDHIFSHCRKDFDSANFFICSQGSENLQMQFTPRLAAASAPSEIDLRQAKLQDLLHNGSKEMALKVYENVMKVLCQQWFYPTEKASVFIQHLAQQRGCFQFNFSAPALRSLLRSLDQFFASASLQSQFAFPVCQDIFCFLGAFDSKKEIADSLVIYSDLMDQREDRPEFIEAVAKHGRLSPDASLRVSATFFWYKVRELLQRSKQPDHTRNTTQPKVMPFFLVRADSLGVHIDVLNIYHDGSTWTALLDDKAGQAEMYVQSLLKGGANLHSDPLGKYCELTFGAWDELKKCLLQSEIGHCLMLKEQTLTTIDAFGKFTSVSHRSISHNSWFDWMQEDLQTVCEDDIVALTLSQQPVLPYIAKRNQIHPALGILPITSNQSENAGATLHKLFAASACDEALLVVESKASTQWPSSVRSIAKLHVEAIVQMVQMHTSGLHLLSVPENWLPIFELTCKEEIEQTKDSCMKAWVQKSATKDELLQRLLPLFKMLEQYVHQSLTTDRVEQNGIFDFFRLARFIPQHILIDYFQSINLYARIDLAYMGELVSKHVDRHWQTLATKGRQVLQNAMIASIVAVEQDRELQMYAGSSRQFLQKYLEENALSSSYALFKTFNHFPRFVQLATLFRLASFLISGEHSRPLPTHLRQESLVAILQFPGKIVVAKTAAECKQALSLQQSAIIISTPNALQTTHVAEHENRKFLTFFSYLPEDLSRDAMMICRWNHVVRQAAKKYDVQSLHLFYREASTQLLPSSLCPLFAVTHADGFLPNTQTTLQTLSTDASNHLTQPYERPLEQAVLNAFLAHHLFMQAVGRIVVYNREHRQQINEQVVSSTKPKIISCSDRLSNQAKASFFKALMSYLQDNDSARYRQNVQSVLLHSDFASIQSSLDLSEHAARIEQYEHSLLSDEKEKFLDFLRESPLLNSLYQNSQLENSLRREEKLLLVVDTLAAAKFVKALIRRMTKDQLEVVICEPKAGTEQITLIQQLYRSSPNPARVVTIVPEAAIDTLSKFPYIDSIFLCNVVPSVRPDVAIEQLVKARSSPLSNLYKLDFATPHEFFKSIFKQECEAWEKFFFPEKSMACDLVSQFHRFLTILEKQVIRREINHEFDAPSIKPRLERNLGLLKTSVSHDTLLAITSNSTCLLRGKK